MRVIAGTAKGRRLGRVPGGVRPVSDRAREGIFSSLAGDVAGAAVLDLFAGTGAMAIEALSRGAARATLVERSRPALAAIRANLAITGLAADVVASDVPTFLIRNDKKGTPFDLVFVDPPYDLGLPEVESLLGELSGGWLEGAAWTVVLTRRSGSSTPVVPVHWALARTLSYGDSAVTLFRSDRQS